jgi:cell division protein FtsB
LRLRWILASGLALSALYFALFGGEYGYFEVRRLERERRQEQAQLEQLQRELKDLQARRATLQNDSATLERLAREKYGLIRDGERLYRFVDSVPERPVAPADSGARRSPR